jgi:hypothetical protein
MDPSTARLLADAILLLHVLVVGFVVGGEVLFLVGGARAWHWVGHRGLRVTHVALMVFIALQAWLGQVCPLTTWEQELRRRAGETAYAESFIEHWLARLLYVEAPWWAFVAAYTAFAALVLATWRWVPPRRRTRAPG